MVEKHPYSPTPGGISNAITQFRKSFPKTVNSETLKQLGIAPKNESYIINVLRFIKAIDKEGKQTEKAATAFANHSDDDFQKAFEDLIKDAYSDLFALHKDSAWGIPADKLISFFRSTDKTSDLVGRLQATTFQLLSSFAGHGTAPTAATLKSSTKTKAAKPKVAKLTPNTSNVQGANGKQRDVGLTVRIEVNLPPAADQETYDRIFRSIRENLLNAQ